MQHDGTPPCLTDAANACLMLHQAHASSVPRPLPLSPRKTLVRHVLIAIGLMLLVVGVGTLWGGISYQRTEREAGQQLSRRLQAADMLLGALLTRAVDAATVVAADLADGSGAAPARLAAALNSRLQVWGDDFEFDLVDRSGSLASTDAHAAPAGAPNAAAVAGRVSLLSGSGTIGPPYRRGNRWMLPVYVDAGPDRWVVASISLATVKAQWQPLDLPPQAIVALIGPDQRLWLRRPFDDSLIGRSVPWPKLLEDIRASTDVRGLSSRRASAIDGIERRYAWTEVAAAPGLHLIAGLPIGYIARTWLAAFSLPAAATLVLAAAMALAAPLVLRQARRAERARHQAVEQLRVTEERWQFALDGSDVGVWDWDAASDTVYFSPRWKAMLGYAVDEIGDALQEWSSRVHPDDRDAVFAELTPHLRGRTPFYTSEHRMRCKDGSYLWIHDRGKVMSRGPDNEPLRIVGTHTDISDRKRADDALLAQAAAERASRAKSEFLSRMSHELRTPLNAVLGFAQLLRHDPLHPLDGAQRLRVEQIERSGSHLLALINEILDLSRIEADRLPVSLGPVPVHGAITAAMSLVLPQAAQQGVALHAPAVAADDPVVRADATRLTQILVNLLTNAIKYNRAAGQVRVHGELRAMPQGAPPQVAIVVADSGNGLTDVQLTQLFQPFNRLGAESSGIEGTGIGLVLSRRLARLMHGDLEIASEVGRGTRATLLLPAWPATPATIKTAAPSPAAATPSAEPIAAAPVPTTAPRVDAERGAQPPCPAPALAAANRADRAFHLLYIEHSNLGGQLMKQILRLRRLVTLTVVGDAHEAIDAATRQCPDLLMMDITLPDQDGRSALATLRAHPALQGIDVCALVTRAHTAAATPAAAVSGFDLALSQPLDVAAFIALLDRQIARAAGRPRST